MGGWVPGFVPQLFLHARGSVWGQGARNEAFDLRAGVERGRCSLEGLFGFKRTSKL